MLTDTHTGIQILVGGTPMPGIHHATAISGTPTRNLDFFTRILGLRFVKKTVNFDDPGAYHPKSLSLGDAAIEQIVVIIRNGNESLGYTGAPDGRATGGGEGVGWACRSRHFCRSHPCGMGQRRAGDAARTAPIFHRIPQARRVVRRLRVELPAALHEPECAD